MNKNLAFTLIELLVVIAVIGILSGLIVVSMSGTTEKATIAKAQIFSNSLRNSLMLNLIGEWKLDEGKDGYANNTWGTVTTGTLYNFASTVAGGGDSPSSTEGWMSSNYCVSGTCLKFDGSNDYVDAGSAMTENITNKLTIGVWIKTTITNKDVFNKAVGTGNLRSFGLLINTDGIVRMAYSSDGATWSYVPGSSNVADGKWNYIVISLNGSKAYTYINGVQDVLPTNYSSTIFSSPTVTFKIGASYFISPFNGLIDEVRLYNEGVSASYVKEQYYLGLNNLLINGSITKEEYLSRTSDLAIK
jgi:prepilin-type N-terminal cleavage/methylation domain-containing protein